MSRTKQKFKKGTRVRVTVGHKIWEHIDGVVTIIDISPELTKDKATVMYTYDQEYGGGNITDYCLKFDKYGEISWFDEKVIVPLKFSKKQLNTL